MKTSTLRVEVQMPSMTRLQSLVDRLRNSPLQWTGNLWQEFEKVGLNKELGCDGVGSSSSSIGG